MPNYDYECAACGNAFEAFQKITDKHLLDCPKCGKVLRRLIGSGSGVIFKGPGFYATDYRKNAGAPKEKPNSCPKARDGCSGCQRNA
jgi:putative FmdB family regulatory protein